MENIHETLRSVRKAASAPFTRVPHTPFWYPPAIAAYFAVVFGAFILLTDGRNTLGAILLLASVAAVILVTLTIRSRWGTWPRLAEAPGEVKRAFILYVLFGSLAIAMSVSIWFWFGSISGLVTVFLTTLTAVWAYEFRLYPLAVRRVQRRLA